MTWPRYLAEFHESRPGITEAVLARATRCGRTAYEWLDEAVSPQGRVLDLACGSAPLWAAFHFGGYVGVDASAAELAVARDRGAGPLLRADALALPLVAGSVDVVMCSMALMVLTPTGEVLAEIRRVLRPGGSLVAMLPATGPLTGSDMLVAGGLLAAIGRRLRYPGDEALRDARGLLDRAGLRLVADERRRFGFRPHRPRDVDLFADSLYLPGATGRARRRARAVLAGAARAHAEFPVPLRRIVASAA